MEKKYSSNNTNSQRNNNSYKKREYSNNSFQKKEYGNSERSSDKPYYTKKEYGSSERTYNKKEYNSDRTKTNSGFKKSYNPNLKDTSNEGGYRKPYNPNFKDTSNEGGYKKSYNPNFKRNNSYKKPFIKKNYNTEIEQQDNTPETGEIRLNKYIANAGICSRRNADIYIAAGNVEVNGQVMTTLGYRVQPTDVVKFDGKVISSEKKEYILLNKPKGFITTTSDEKGRKTVMDLVANATTARILPVGRLDRPTTGLLLLTNDGDLAKKLTHPTHGVRKIYHVVLDRKLDYKDFIKIEEGIELEDGFIQVDEISYVNDKPKNEIGVKIHSGRNRIVRRIFEHLGYEIEKLDRVVFAGLTKKDLPRGHWRKLTQQEIINLRNIK
ncbi:pseudouridine synthase [Capnocytophaga canis]|uniref:pseudouridine synthase n=1 Tax=Capnocytophaga canis TaxID=1848903 RepID=UPI00156290F7|nr:pseudouridine synthase [Capnocytophaga canis]GIM61481.1 pseudouridine synthase [Capnocytophaga canis]